MFYEYNLKFISKIKFKNFCSKTFTYESNLDFNKKKYVLLNNLGYNFSRIVLILFVKRYNILVPDTLSEKKIGFFKRIVYYFLNVKFLKLSKKNSIQCKLKIPNINFQYKNLKLSKVLNYFKDQEIGNRLS